MNIRWLIQLFVYCVGSLFCNETFFCSHAGCNRQFQSRSGRDGHIRISHRAREKEYCRYGCGKSYPKGILLYYLCNFGKYLTNQNIAIKQFYLSINPFRRYRYDHRNYK